MDTITHPHPAAMMQTYPGRASGSVYQRIEQRPVGDRIAPVKHGFGFAVGRGHGTRIQVITADDDRGFYRPCPNQFIESKSALLPLTLSQPANAGGQTLEGNTFLGQLQPALKG